MQDVTVTECCLAHGLGRGDPGKLASSHYLCRGKRQREDASWEGGLTQPGSARNLILDSQHPEACKTNVMEVTTLASCWSRLTQETRFQLFPRSPHLILPLTVQEIHDHNSFL